MTHRFTIHRQKIRLTLSVILLLLLSACDNMNFKQLSETRSGLPDSITIIEAFNIAATVCSTKAGFRVVHGLDHNHDGKLSPYERQQEDIVCNPDALPGTQANAVAIVPNAQPHLQ